MEVTVKLKNLRISPQKVRLVLPIIKRQSADHALEILKFTRKAIARDLYKLVRSAIAAAEEKKMSREALVIKQSSCDGGQSLKRHRYRSRGRVVPIEKKSSHITITLTDNPKTKITDKPKDVSKENDIKPKNIESKKPKKEVKPKKITKTAKKESK